MFSSPRDQLAAHGPWPRRVAALICLALAALSAVPHSSAARPDGPTTAVQVATHALGAGHVLTAVDLRTRSLPRSALPRSLPRTRLIGRRLAGPVAAGEPVNGLRLVGDDLTSGLPSLTVAVGVDVDDPHVTDFVHAGDRVDVVAPTPDDADPGRSGGATDAPTVARGVRVLAVLPGTDGSTDASGAVANAEVVVAAPRDVAITLARIRGIGPASVLASSP